MERIVNVLDGVQISFHNHVFDVKGPKGELKREFVHPEVSMSVSGNTVKIKSEEERRKVYAVLGAWESHVKNMMTGVLKGYEMKMKIVYSHFPIKLSVEGRKVLISNFLGERRARIANVVGDAKIEMKKDDIVVAGISKEDVSQTAANIELAAKVKKKDRRIFSDGVWIASKCVPAGSL